MAGVLLGLELNQTGLIHSHGNDLYGVNPTLLKYQASIQTQCSFVCTQPEVNLLQFFSIQLA